MPTVYSLTPDNKPTWLDSAGDPASGFQLFVYEAGTTTKATTYRDSDGLVANTNPVVLDSRGEPPHGIYVESGTYKLVLAPDTDTDPPSSAVWTRDDITPINNVAGATADEWTESGLTPTYVSATQFTLAGDQTTEFHEGRRVRITDSGGTDYGVITASAYTSLTTVTVSLDSGSIDSGISAVDYSILSAANSSIPHAKSDTGGLAFTGDIQLASGSLRLQQGSDVASAATLPVNVDGNFFDVTGTTSITALASKGVGTEVTLQFDDVLTLTHNATDLVLPGARDITTAAGDIAKLYEYASGDWRLVSYERASGSNSILVSSTTTGGTSVDFVIPTGATEINGALIAISTAGATDDIWVQLGYSGGVETSGYSGAMVRHNASSNSHLANSSGFVVSDNVALAEVCNVVFMLRLVVPGSNTWAFTSWTDEANGDNNEFNVGFKSLSGALTTVRITTAGGTATFDAMNGAVRYTF